MLVGPLAQGTAQDVNRLGEVAFLDHHVGPDRGEQGGLVDDLAGVLDQVEQRIERARGQIERVSIALQDATPGIESEFLELIDAWRVGLGF